MTITLIDRKKFAGGANIAPDSDSGKELGDDILELQTACNTNETTAGAAIPKATATAANQIIVGTGAGTVAALAVAASRIVGRTGAGVLDDLAKADVLTILNVEDGADVTDAANVATAGAAMKSTLTTVGDLFTVVSVAPVVLDRIAAGAVGSVLKGLGAGVKPAFGGVAGLAADVLDAVVAVADSAAGVATVLGSVQVNDLAGAPIAHVVEGLLLAQSTQYGGRNAIQAHVTYSLATAGSILASGAGWCVFKTDATGLFACTLTNASDEVVYHSVTGVDGGVDALGAGMIVRGCVPDASTWGP